MKVDGFYRGYFTGTGGNGIAILLFLGGNIVGVDIGGVAFDGSYEYIEGERILGNVQVKIPANTPTIQGIAVSPNEICYTVEFVSPIDFESIPYLELVTPLGKINVRMEKVRDA